MTQKIYARYDAETRWCYKADLQNRARELGYASISRAIAEEYIKSGFNSHETARLFGWRRQTLIRHVRRLGLPVRSKGGANHRARWITLENEWAVRRLVASGAKPAEIAAAFGVTPSAVRSWLRNRGLLKMQRGEPQ